MLRQLIQEIIHFGQKCLRVYFCSTAIFAFANFAFANMPAAHSPVGLTPGPCPRMIVAVPGEKRQPTAPGQRRPGEAKEVTVVLPGEDGLHTEAPPIGEADTQTCANGVEYLQQQGQSLREGR